MKITGAIFDMDGTLLNSMDYWATVADEYLESIGITPREDTCRRFLEDGMKNWHEYCQREYGLEAPFDEAKRGIYALMDVKYKTVVALKDGALEMLDELYKRSIPMCLATATDRASVEAILSRLGIDKYFSRIFTSGEVGAGKRDPLIYNVALQYLGTDKETTYVFEDALYAMRTAYTNGFKVVGVYDKNAYAPKEELRSLCHVYLDEGSRYALDFE